MGRYGLLAQQGICAVDINLVVEQGSSGMTRELHSLFITTKGLSPSPRRNLSYGGFQTFQKKESLHASISITNQSS
jgi:hypothetical protein